MLWPYNISQHDVIRCPRSLSRVPGILDVTVGRTALYSAVESRLGGKERKRNVGALAKRAARLPFYYGWTVAAAAALVMFTASGVQASFGILLAAMERDLGWSRGQLSLAFTLYVITQTTASMATGRLTDRWGPQRVVLAGGALLATGVALLSIAHAPWQLYLFYSLVSGLGMSGAYVPCTTAVVRWFLLRRGLALSFANLGSSLGIFLLPLAMGAVVATLGWRTAYLGAGVIVFVIVFLASRFFLRDPESVGLAVTVPATGDFSEPASLRLGEAVRTRNFWLFAAAFIAALSVGLIPVVHLPALVTLDRGGSPAQGALAASLIGGGAIAGVLMAGPLSDRIGRRAVVLLAVAAEATAYLGWALEPGMVLLFSFIFGIFYGGSIVLMPAMAGDLFGRAHVGTVFGVVFAGIGWAASLGVLGAGFGRDILGSYELVFQLAFLRCLVSMGLFLLLRVPQNKANQESGGGQR